MNIHTTFTHIFWSQELTVVYTWGVPALIRSVAFAEVFLMDTEDAVADIESRQYYP